MNRFTRISYCLFLVITTEARAQIEPGALVDLAVTSAPTSLIGAVAGNRLGSAFASGDFDGDGELDLAILASSTTAVDTLPPFIVIIFDCDALTGVLDLAEYSGEVAIIKAPPGDAGTWAKLVAGDFNGDHVDDVAFGIPNNSQGTNYDGKVHVVFGTSSLVGATILLQSPTVPTSTLFSQAGSGGWLGMGMASGDVNNDGRDELIVSAPFYSPGGRVYVLPGHTTFPATIPLETHPNVSKIIETNADQACGIGLACGDADIDGFDDIVVGAPGDGLANARGIVSLVVGTANVPSTILLSANTPNVKRFYDEYSNGGLGWRTELADMDGDGRRDIVMAAPVADPLGCQDCGEVYAVYWDTSLPDSVYMGTSSVPMTRYIGSGHNLNYGESLVAGRINADLCADLVMKREPDDFIPMDRRSAVITYGSAFRPDTVFLNTDAEVTRVLAEQPGDNIGIGLAVFDLDGNGLGEALIGAPLTNALGRTRAGKVHIFDGFSSVSGVSPPRTGIAIRVHPNPFSASAVLELTAPIEQRGSLSIYDVRGQRVYHVDRLHFEDESSEITWDGRDDAGRKLPSGVYFCRLDLGSARSTRKLILLR